MRTKTEENHAPHTIHHFEASRIRSSERHPRAVRAGIPAVEKRHLQIIREYGGTIEKTTLLEDSFAIRRLGRHRFSIAVPAHFGRKDTPYFYAVALGYLFVVMGYDTDVEEWSSSTVLYEDEEYSLEHFLLAQYFALVLLMPADVFVAVVKSATYKGKCFVGEVADWFGLPAPVVIERGRMLNLL